ncbi:hypothetical protein M885DRAFT_618063 [Pelagophyceae sp. CCMP2097]|nr:hypothetical protein M885DRAFT_618063 [Pelagophyceae sp. CCMP2097]
MASLVALKLLAAPKSGGADARSCDDVARDAAAHGCADDVVSALKRDGVDGEMLSAFGASVVIDDLGVSMTANRRRGVMLALSGNASKGGSGPTKGGEERARKGFLDFLRVSVFLGGFLVMMALHQSITEVYELEHAVRFELTEVSFGKGKVFADIADTPMFWDWFHGAFAAVMFRQVDEFNKTTPHSEWGYLATYNRLIGGVRLVQTRSEARKCGSKLLGDFYGVGCFPVDTVDTRSFGLEACNATRSGNATRGGRFLAVDGGESFAGERCFDAEDYDAVDYYHNEGFSVDGSETFEFWLDALEPRSRIEQRIRYLEDRHWIDKQTKTVRIELLIYNGQLEPLLCEVILSFDFHRTGFVVPSHFIETVPVFPYLLGFWFKVCLEVVYVCIITSILHEEICEVLQRLRQDKAAGLRGALLHHLATGDGALGNWVSMLNALFGVLLICFWVPLVYDLHAVTNALASLERPAGLANYVDDDMDHWSIFHRDVTAIEAQVARSVRDMRQIRFVGAANVFLVLLRFLRSWTNIPALRVIAVTLFATVRKLASVGIIIICLIVVFAGAGMLMFGQVLQEFHTFKEAAVTTILIFFTADVTVYQKQREVDELSAALWNFLVFAILFFVMVNMVLAIIVEAYEEASKSCSEAVPLYQTAWESAAFLCHKLADWRPGRIHPSPAGNADAAVDPADEKATPWDSTYPGPTQRPVASQLPALSTRAWRRSEAKEEDRAGLDGLT